MARWRISLLVTLACIATVAACARRSDDTALFLSQTPLALRANPTASPMSATRGNAAVPTRRPTSITVARGGTGTGKVQDGSRPVLVFLDPGHGGVDRGTSGTDVNGIAVAEKTIALALAHRTAALLRADGIGVALSRDDDSLVGLHSTDYTGDGKLLTPDGVLHDLQGRVDRANASGALVFLSIHLNAFTDPAISGSETFYDPDRSFADQNERFARLIEDHLVQSMKEHDTPVADRGVTDDTSLQTEDLGSLGLPYNHLVVLGPGIPGRLRPAQMPGALSEPLFLSNPNEATAAEQPEVQDAISRAYADAIEEFLRT